MNYLYIILCVLCAYVLKKIFNLITHAPSVFYQKFGLKTIKKVIKNEKNCNAFYSLPVTYVL